MDGYYYNYLVNSDCYKKINSAIANIKIQISNVETLKKSFASASGNNIELIKNDLDGIINDLNKYAGSLNSIISQLVSNANTFDIVLNNWKAKIGDNYSNPVEAPPVVSNGDFNNISYRTSYEIIDGVSVSSNGYINVRVKSFIKSVSKNVTENTSTTSIFGITYNTYEHGFDGDYV